MTSPLVTDQIYKSLCASPTPEPCSAIQAQLEAVTGRFCSRWRVIECLEALEADGLAEYIWVGWERWWRAKP